MKMSEDSSVHTSDIVQLVQLFAFLDFPEYHLVPEGADACQLHCERLVVQRLIQRPVALVQS